MNTVKESGGVWWVHLFVARTFFGACEDHNAPNNSEKHYCITCEKAACPHCLAEGAHKDHKVVTVYRLVYKDVVILSAISRHLDCSKVQPYTSNGKLVVALTPLPHQGSGALKPSHLSCRHCARKLMNSDRFKYCSIACKYDVTSDKPTTKPKPKRSQQDKDKGPDRDGSARRDAIKKLEDQMHMRPKKTGTARRKGSPVRAPFR